MDRDKFIIYTVFVFSLRIGGDGNVYTEAQNSQENNECITPNDSNCINITRCPRLHYPLENEKQHFSISINYRRNAMCVNEDISTYYPKVSCPLKNERTTYNETSQRTTTSNNDSTVSTIYKIDSPIKFPSQESYGQRFYTTFYTTLFEELDPGFTSFKPIIKGRISKKRGNWPWMAALGYQHPNMPANSLYRWKCGGSLISDRYVLTAAHCTVDVGMYCLTVVRVGHWVENMLGEVIDVAISRVTRHKEYNAQKMTNDIALLKLNYSVEFNDVIRPISLPTFWEHTYFKYDLTVIGRGAIFFGEYNFLMEAEVRVKDHSTCNETYYNNTRYVIDDKMLCAGSPNGADACQGDSGGPLMWKNGNRYYLVGIVSFGYKCGEPDYPGVYTRVTSFIEWINDNMN